GRVLIRRESVLMPPYNQEQPYKEDSEFENTRAPDEYGVTVKEYNVQMRKYNENLAKNTIVKSEWSPRHMLPNQDYKGDTPLHIATQEKLLEPVKLLLHTGADINVKNGYWQTPLHMAISAAEQYDDTKATEIV